MSEKILAILQENMKLKMATYFSFIIIEKKLGKL